jgi:hypothetical protein
VYKIIKASSLIGGPDHILRISDNSFIPREIANTDYTKFKNEIQGIGSENTTIEPVELQDAEGNTMTAEEVAEFIATLP